MPETEIKENASTKELKKERTKEIKKHLCSDASRIAAMVWTEIFSYISVMDQVVS